MKRLSASILWLVVAWMLLQVPAQARTHNTAHTQKQAQKNAKKYNKQQAKAQRKQLKAQKKQMKAQNKAARKWNKNHHPLTTT